MPVWTRDPVSGCPFLPLTISALPSRRSSASLSHNPCKGYKEEISKIFQEQLAWPGWQSFFFHLCWSRFNWKRLCDDCGLPITSHGHYLTHVKYIRPSLVQYRSGSKPICWRKCEVMKVSKHDSLHKRRRDTVSFQVYEWSRRVTFHVVTGRTQHPALEHYNFREKVAMTPCIVLWNGEFDMLSSPPLADNDVDAAETELKEGEWQNISWLPFHLNTSIKARRGGVSGIASAPDTDSPGFMQEKKIECLLLWWLIRSPTWRITVKNTSCQVHYITAAYFHS